MKIAAAIRHVHFEDLGAFEPALAESGYALRYFAAGVDDLGSPELLECGLLIVLGGPIGVYEGDKYPFLRQEIGLLERRLASGRPTMGICLGAQLLASALGSRVYPGPQKEIGWSPITLTEAGERSPARHLGSGPVLHWHGDTFDLPAGAELLASTAICKNQAFRYGNHTLAFQFHPEATTKTFEQWLIGHCVEIGGVPGLSVNALRADTERFAPEAQERGRRCFSEWLAGISQSANAAPLT